MKLINLTPHPVTFYSYSETQVTIPPSGKVARVVEEPTAEFHLEDIPVPVVDIKTGRVVDLPGPQPGVVYIVSRPVALAIAGERSDVLVPDDFVRDENGRIIGARRLARFVREE